MKRLLYSLIFFVATLKSEGSDPLIRVLLDTVSPIKKSRYCEYTITSNAGFSLYTDNREKILSIDDTALTLRVGQGELHIASESIKPRKVRANTITIIPAHKRFRINTQEFSGTLSVHLSPSRSLPLLINTLPLETYVYSVLRYETYQNWPKEVHKVQAVVSRSYALHHMINARRRGLAYDIKNSNHHQTYQGHHSYKHLHEAIAETRGVTLTYKSTPILAMFDACCGGITPADMIPHNISFKEAPYLAREKPCTFCGESKLNRWSLTLSPYRLREELMKSEATRKFIKEIGSIKNVFVNQKDKAGTVRKVLLEGTRNNVIIPARHFWDSLKPRLRSLTFKVKTILHDDKAPSLYFSGRGFGHQIGLCQHGAHSLVKSGWSYQDVLNFYYPSAQTSRLKVEKKE